MTTLQPLSPEEQKSHQDFVYHCVMNNIVLNSPAKFGRELKLTIQDMAHSTVATLREIGKQIERVVRDAGASDFSADGPLKINGIEGSRWTDWLKLQIRTTQIAEDMATKKQKLMALKAQLEEFKTPGEKRTEIEAAIAELEGRTVGQPVVIG